LSSQTSKKKLLAYFSKAESKGIGLLLFLLLAYFAIPKLLKSSEKTSAEAAETNVDTQTQALLQRKEETQNSFYKNKYPQYSKSNFSADKYESDKGHTINITKTFDPNSSTLSDFKAMGFPNFLAERIIKYRDAGGVFKSPESIEKIYGMDPEIAAAIKPFIKIEGNNQLATNKPFTEAKFTPKTIPAKFDLNTADTTQLIQVKGIGPAFARRIIAFRNKLGGFYSGNQVFETFGIDSVAAAALQKNSFVHAQDIQKITINKSQTLNHPYLKPWVAKAIIAYRNEHGPYQQPTDLLKVKIMDAKTLEKLQPYLLFTL
jgi:competence protein ComEA